MSFATIDDLRESLAHPARKPRSPEYVAKMIHGVPAASVVDRIAFVVERVRGKRVLDLGASGHLHEAIVSAADSVIGLDRVSAAGVIACDLDDVTMATLPVPTDFVPQIVVLGEVLEHLSNPGHLLDRLRRRYPNVLLIVSVPNAFSSIAATHMEDGIENVNRDHVCWFSYRTLLTLLERHGYEMAECFWYNGLPLTAEGIVMVTR